MSDRKRSLPRIGSLALHTPPFSKDLSCLDVCNFFAANPDILTVAVVDEERPIGLINRDEFLLLFSSQFGHALFDKKPVASAMDPVPLIVDGTSSVGMVSNLILNEKPSALLKGFIITRDERYFGVGTALELLRYSIVRSKEREQELETARREAVLANEAKTQFLANMSHELRTPLNAIIGFSEIMYGELLGPIGNDRYREYANDIGESGQYLLGLVNDILDIAQVETGQLKLREQGFDLHELIDRCFIQLDSKAQNAQVSLINEVPCELPELHADERKLRQVMLNLLSNAIKFTPCDGRIAVKSCFTPKGELLIQVQDTGIGIEPKNIPLVLQKFGQVENSYQRKYDGVGLGLPLAKSLIEMHGGKLWIKSAMGKGTTVCFTLPSARLGANAAPLALGA
ncbi:MAG: ATP-binding protein [Pseudomonadota bacterium]|nr:histidine kinase [Alphaproteobacteria bacterium]